MTSILIAGFALLIACQESPRYQTDWHPNPNGDSELALMMRDMFDEAMNMKLDILEQHRPDPSGDYSRMLTADATEPDKLEREDYKAFTLAYQNSLKRIDASDIGELHDAYTSMVQTCVSCHQAMCPGPIARINHLWLDEKVQMSE